MGSNRDNLVSFCVNIARQAMKLKFYKLRDKVYASTYKFPL